MIRYCWYDTPVGRLAVAEEDGSLVSVSSHAPKEGREERTPLTDGAGSQLQEYFQGKRQAFSLPLSFRGTPFQLKVWKVLQSIPYGETRSYRQIAEAAGNVKAVRAVGMANNRNPFMIVVPCHRVIGSDGSLVGYASGVENKRFLLELEKGFKK